jgi:hypothetical protein
MASARPLRDVFADLAGAPSDDPGALLRDQGHPALPDDLIAEAVVSYADTAPVEVAAADWAGLLSTAPAGDPAAIDDQPPAPEDVDDGIGLDFGMGAEPAHPVETGDDVAGHDEDAPADLLADPAGLDDGGETVEWPPAAPAADPVDDEFDDGFDDDGEPDGEPLG